VIFVRQDLKDDLIRKILIFKTHPRALFFKSASLILLLSFISKEKMDRINRIYRIKERSLTS